MATKQVTTKLDWGKIVSTLGLTGSTASSLLAFRKRNEDAKTKVNHLEQEDVSIDFAYYKSVLKNQKIVSEVEAAFKSFKPVTYDISKQIKVIETFEAKALENAESTESKVKEELGALKSTLDNIKSARAFEDLVVEDMTKAAPEIDKKVAEMVQKGRWNVPGYEEKFGSTVVM
ncbi:ATP synthase subunit d, mitochondrial [Wickerhamiella sorbophila]|uniref:ATP synthase subunit d, mitochondrial n=1 Tax=Wickerhamiella sorbophila TaxID=45607 RepID=A0A2T0FBM1_9ASCO|nr:ATP synthase subunit d, mitochondrial [Wickerhamiella sorbophila]PRT52396.1 ATP synthase subunit d, mitochondrial [Wickerhamiella sorbophila]